MTGSAEAAEEGQAAPDWTVRDQRGPDEQARE